MRGDAAGGEAAGGHHHPAGAQGHGVLRPRERPRGRTCQRRCVLSRLLSDRFVYPSIKKIKCPAPLIPSSNEPQKKLQIFVNDAKVGEYGPGGCFGELALIYNAKRAATITATASCTLWALVRRTVGRRGRLSLLLLSLIDIHPQPTPSNQNRTSAPSGGSSPRPPPPPPWPASSSFARCLSSTTSATTRCALGEEEMYAICVWCLVHRSV